MKRFLKRIFIFLIVIIVVLITGFLLPPTPKVSRSLLFSQIDKDQLLKTSNGPRLIMVGGSNLSFGINSKLLKDSTNLYPINLGIHANLGLEYMLNHVRQFILSTDVVLVIPEYGQFYGKEMYGQEELVRMIFDVRVDKINSLSFRQWLNMSPYFIRYACTKYNIKDYLESPGNSGGVYDRTSFNSYGDAVGHWSLQRELVEAYPAVDGRFNEAALQKLEEFREAVTAKGAKLLVGYPGFQIQSFDNNIVTIREVEQKLKEHNFITVGSPYRYKMPDSLIYNTPFHLTKQGAEIRTRQLIKDLRGLL